MLPNAAAETPLQVHGKRGAAAAVDAAPYPFWTPARDAELLALYARTGPERLLREQIAERLGVSFCAVRNRLNRLGARRSDWHAGRGFPRAAPGPRSGDRVLDDDPAVPPTGRVTFALHRVRCLGVAEPAHHFWSEDPARHRVCARCQRLRGQGGEMGALDDAA